MVVPYAANVIASVASRHVDKSSTISLFGRSCHGQEDCDVKFSACTAAEALRGSFLRQPMQQSLCHSKISCENIEDQFLSIFMRLREVFFLRVLQSTAHITHIKCFLINGISMKHSDPNHIPRDFSLLISTLHSRWARLWQILLPMEPMLLEATWVHPKLMENGENNNFSGESSFWYSSVDIFQLMNVDQFSPFEWA